MVFDFVGKMCFQSFWYVNLLGSVVYVACLRAAIKMAKICLCCKIAGLVGDSDNFLVLVSVTPKGLPVVYWSFFFGIWSCLWVTFSSPFKVMCEMPTWICYALQKRMTPHTVQLNTMSGSCSWRDLRKGFKVSFGSEHECPWAFPFVLYAVLTLFSSRYWRTLDNVHLSFSLAFIPTWFN